MCEREGGEEGEGGSGRFRVGNERGWKGREGDATGHLTTSSHTKHGSKNASTLRQFSVRSWYLSGSYQPIQ